jgi:putative protease
MGDTLRITYPIDIQQAKSPQQVGQNLLKIFSSPGEGWFTARSVKLENRSAWNDGELFLPLSRLKEIRRSWYEYLGSACERAIMTPRPPAHGTSGSVHPLPMRHLLNPKIDDHLPWADPVSVQRRLAANMAAEDVLAVIDDKLYLPLAPVTFDEKAAMKALDEIIAACGGRVRIGLNNVAHLGWARKHPGIEVFADVYLYMSNREAAALVLHTMPTLVGMYRWIEREEGGTAGWMMKPSAIGPAFKLPLFISRNCFRYDAMGLPCEGCPRHGTWHVNQTGKRYRVDVRECVTIVSEEPEHQ